MQNIQKERYKKEGIFYNSELNDNQIKKYCKINSESKKLLEIAFNKLGLSVRAYSRILKVARTIADMEAKEQIEKKHIAEAVQYRCFDKNINLKKEEIL